MSHYEDLDQPQDYPSQVESVSSKKNTLVTAYLDSLGDIVSIGIGVDAQESRENYLLEIDKLTHILDEARVKVMYEIDQLTYTVIKGE